ncbi:MAG: glucosyltransferase domain-containing protein [Faecousia sp.]
MEQENIRRPFLLETAANWLGLKIKENKVPLLASVIVGMLAYVFAFTNKLVNHDEVFTLFFKGGTLGSGRWGLGLLDHIFPNYSMPWIYGVITIVLMAVSVCIIVHLFAVRSKLLQALLAGCIVAFPSLIGTVAYMFTVSSYTLSFLLAVLAVWLLEKEPKRCFLPALVCMIASLSIYQPYISVAASMLVLLLIQKLLQGQDVASVIRRGFVFLGFLIVSLGLYYLATLLINRVTGNSFSGYADGNLSFHLADIPSGIADAYTTFFRYLSEGFRGLIPTAFSRWMHYLCFAATAVLLVLWVLSQKGRQVGRFLLLAALIVLLPLAINCMHLFATADAVHTLVLYGFIAVYILFVILAEASLPQALPSRIAANVITVCLAAVITANIYIANESYLNLYLRYENAYAFYTSLIADIKMTPGFDKNTKLAVIGTYQEPAFYLEKFYYTDELTGVDGFLPDNYSNERFLEYYLGFPIPFASDQEIQAIQETVEYQEMAVYPYYGSLKLIGDILVVKLS